MNPSLHNPSNRPVDGRTFAIGVLSVTACILFVGFMLTAQQPAVAIGTSDKGGDFKLVTQQINHSTEAVVVIDAAAKRAIIYGFDISRKELQIIAHIPLDELPQPREPVGDAPADRRRRP